MAITTSTFLKNIILFIRDSLRNSITDPISRTTPHDFILTAYPKKKVQYPVITIKQTNITSIKMGMQSEVHWVELNLEVRIWAKTSEQSDALTEDVINALRSLEFGTSSTTDEKIYGFTVNSVVPIVEADGDNTVHSKVLEIKYNCILED